MPMNAIPMLILTGFLGAGKTTLLNRMISHYRGRTERLAVLVNEFGAAGIDGQLLDEGQYDLHELNRGSLFCICVKKDFIRILGDIARMEFPPDLLLVEATGLADPGDLSAYLDEPPLAGRYRVSANICMADAQRFHKVLETLPAVRNQVEQASLLLLNKTDLVDAGRVEELRKMLREINPTAPIHSTVYARLTADVLPDHLNGGQCRGRASLSTLPPTGPPPGITSVTLETNGRPARRRWEAFLETLPKDLLRGKGIVDLDDGKRYRIELVGAEWKLFLMDNRAPEATAAQPCGRVLLIGQGLDGESLLADGRFEDMRLRIA